MHDFKKLEVWKLGMELVQDIYVSTGGFPKAEIYGLTSQIRKSVVSVPSNIAEGAGRSSDKDFILFLHYAYGSSCELDTQLMVAHRLGYMNDDKYRLLTDKIDKLQKMLYKLIGTYNITSGNTRR